MISAEHTDTHDELRARFTSWLDTTIYRARLKYLAKEANRIPCTSLDSVSEECLWSFDDYQFAISREYQFDFEEERLSKAFANLPADPAHALRGRAKTGRDCPAAPLLCPACLRPAVSNDP